MKKVSIVVLMLLLLVLQAGCGANYTIEDNGTITATEGLTVQSTTDTSVLEQEVIGYLNAGLTNWPTDEDGKKIPYEYDGGEIAADIVINAEGIVENVGVMLYFDAKPVPYRLESYGDEASYFHIFRDISNKGDVNSSLVFTPSGFSMGETATLTIAFFPCADYIYDPSDPDVVINGRVSYLSRNWSSAFGDIHFNVDVPDHTDFATPFAKNVRVTTEKDIDAFVNEMNSVIYNNGDFKLTAADLDGEFPYFVEYYDNDLTPSGTICTTGKNAVRLKYKVAGPEGMEIKWGFSLGYQPALIDGEPTYALTLHKGEYYIVEMDIDVSIITQPTKLLSEWFADNQLYGITPIIFYPDSTQGPKPST